MRSFANMMILAWLLFGSGCPVARADGGRLAVMERQGNYQFSVFTSPNPLRAGPVDISVLLQDAKTEQLVDDARVYVNLMPRSETARSIHASATSANATNKLLHSALVELPEPGWWDVEVVCDAEHTPAQVHFAMEAGQRLPCWLTEWPRFSWPFGAVLLFGVHRLLVRRRLVKGGHVGL